MIFAVIGVDGKEINIGIAMSSGKRVTLSAPAYRQAG
jgi:hypothetical protein